MNEIDECIERLERLESLVRSYEQGHAIGSLNQETVGYGDYSKNCAYLEMETMRRNFLVRYAAQARINQIVMRKLRILEELLLLKSPNQCSTRLDIDLALPNPPREDAF